MSHGGPPFFPLPVQVFSGFKHVTDEKNGLRDLYTEWGAATVEAELESRKVGLAVVMRAYYDSCKLSLDTHAVVFPQIETPVPDLPS